MQLLSFLAGALVAPATVSAICAHGTHIFPREAGAAVPIATFGYEGLKGPLNWYGLNKTANSQCSLGKFQSPINVNTTAMSSVSGKTLRFSVDKYPDGAELENLGSTLEVIANGTLTLGDTLYSLAQFHFHTPSEHHVNGEYYPMEAHFVFSSPDKKTAVVGVLIDIATRDDLLLSGVFEKVEECAKPGTACETGPLNPSLLIAHVANNQVYQYGGSLTTPPCTEGVSWNLVQKPIYISAKTFAKVKDILGFNSRYTQNTPGGVNLLDNARNLLDGKA